MYYTYFRRPEPKANEAHNTNSNLLCSPCVHFRKYDLFCTKYNTLILLFL